MESVVATLVVIATVVAVAWTSGLHELGYEYVVLAGVLSAVMLPFSLLLLQAVVRNVEKARTCGFSVNTMLIVDYVDCCFTVSVLSLAELLALVIYALTDSAVAATLAVGLTSGLLFTTSMVVAGLWQITRLLSQSAC